MSRTEPCGEGPPEAKSAFSSVLSELMEKVPGPDFPTGGVIVESPESIL